MKSFLQSQAQQLEQQKMERITQVRKAAVERLLENRRREHAAALASIRPVPILQPEEPAKELTAELPVGEKQIERQPAVQGSGMIFPQLDKESPESSTYETSTAQPVSPVSEKSTIARTVTVASDEEFFEDAESVALHSDDDEGFMTDEEYDILDASDEETQ
jgi:next-to-BRCA1 protein 1